MKFVALHLLVLASAVAGQQESIEPGYVFVATEDEAERLLPLEAVRPFDKELDKHAREFTRAGAQAQLTSDEAVDLFKLKKDQLLKIAEDEEIVIEDPKATNAVIIATIEAARKAVSEDSLV